MSLTNREVINQALVELGIGATAHSSTAEELQDALLRLRGIVAVWTSTGSGGGYAGSNSLDEDSGIPVDGERGLICQLAVDLAPSYGKQASRQTMAAAKSGSSLMARKRAVVPRRRIDVGAIPAGAGHKYEPYRQTLPGYGPDDGEPT